MIRVLLDLESNKIGTEHTFEQFLAGGEAAEDLRRWECCVEKESDLSIWQLLTNHTRN